MTVEPPIDPNNVRTKWLLRQLGRKIRHFPRDQSRRIRRSIRKRRAAKEAIELIPPRHPPAALGETRKPVGPSDVHLSDRLNPYPFGVLPEDRERFHTILASDARAYEAYDAVESFFLSDEMRELTAKAYAIDPLVGLLEGDEPSIGAPWHDVDYHRLRDATNAIPEATYDTVILVPFGRMGGADLVAATLAKTIAADERVLVLRTDDPYWEDVSWYPDNVPAVDVSGALHSITNPQRALYTLLCEIAPRRVFNVNSRLAFDTFVAYGARLSRTMELYAYFFCADHTHRGVETGYPVLYFADVLPHLTAALVDSRDLTETLVERFSLPPELKDRVRTVYTPTKVPPAQQPIATARTGTRPLILWAGRLDRQKRFDLVATIASAMPDVEFRAWGKAVLDAPPKLSRLPKNLTVHPPFRDYGDLPLGEADGWLYTSAWDGLPTILIELGALGVPIVASAVGGVPELIDDKTGWPINDANDVAAYVAALREVITDPDERVRRASALQQRVRERHSRQSYVEAINGIGNAA